MPQATTSLQNRSGIRGVVGSARCICNSNENNDQDGETGDGPNGRHRGHTRALATVDLVCTITFQFPGLAIGASLQHETTGVMITLALGPLVVGTGLALVMAQLPQSFLDIPHIHI